jgi:branched-chain amino acid transport system permease protein
LADRAKRKKRLDRSIKVRTEGLYAVTSWAEMGYLFMPRAVLVVGLLLLPLILDPYWQRVICSAGIYALLAIGFDFLAEYVPCLRLRGIYFAIVSFMFPLFAVFIIIALNVFGGTEGITALDTFPNSWVELYLILAAVIVALFALRRLVNEDMGIILRGIMDNDQAVRASGINITAYKTRAVFIAALLGCFGGAYLSHLYGWLGLSLFAMDFSILPIAACVMGGMGTLVGPVLGAFILTPMSEALRGFGQLRVVLYCLILIGFMVYKPEGIMNILQRKYHQFEVWEEV